MIKTLAEFIDELITPPICAKCSDTLPPVCVECWAREERYWREGWPHIVALCPTHCEDIDNIDCPHLSKRWLPLINEAIESGETSLANIQEWETEKQSLINTLPPIPHYRTREMNADELSHLKNLHTTLFNASLSPKDASLAEDICGFGRRAELDIPPALSEVAKRLKAARRKVTTTTDRLQRLSRKCENATKWPDSGSRKYADYPQFR